jgi:microcystin-dependent protein
VEERSNSISIQERNALGTQYLGEIRIFAGNFIPLNWAACNGQLLQISQNTALFQLLGTTYGGDGQNTFGLPNLSSRVPMHVGNGHVLGELSGTEQVTLTAGQMPQHTHAAVGDNNAVTTNAGDPTNAFYGNANPNQIYANAPSSLNLHTMQTVPAQGGSQPHDNMQPFVTLTFIIATGGVTPSAT